MVGPLRPRLSGLHPCAIEMFETTKGLQHLAVGTRSGFHKAAMGLHCCQTGAATTQAQTIQEQLEKYTKYFWYLGRFRSLVKSMVTDSLGMFNDMIPGTNAIKVHLMAFDVSSRPR